MNTDRNVFIGTLIQHSDLLLFLFLFKCLKLLKISFEFKELASSSFRRGPISSQQRRDLGSWFWLLLAMLAGRPELAAALPDDAVGQ